MLGYHRNIDWPQVGLDPLTVEMQKRSFWVAYTIDRSAAFSLGRPFGIEDTCIDVELPLDVNDEDITTNGLLREHRYDNSQAPTCVSAAIHGIKMRRIWTEIQKISRTSDGLEQHIDYEDLVAIVKSRLQDWLKNRPTESVQDGRESVNFGSDNWFHLSYHHAVLLTHRRRITASVSGPSDAPYQAIHAVHLECAESASSICTIYRTFYLRSPAIYAGWGALHVLFIAGLTFLHCLAVSKEVRETYRSQTSGVCTSCTIVLVIMAERWPAVQPYRDMFTMLSEKMQAVLAQPAADTSGTLVPLVHAEHASDEISGIAALGMCDSVRGLLADMVD